MRVARADLGHVDGRARRRARRPRVGRRRRSCSRRCSSTERPGRTTLRARLQAVLPPDPTTAEEIARLDTLVGQARRRGGRGPRRPSWSPRTGRRSSTGSRAAAPSARCRSASPPGSPRPPARPWSPTCAPPTSPPAGRARRWPARSTSCGCRARRPRAALNLGGIANVTVVGGGVEPVCFDTGPANCLLDVAAAARHGRRARPRPRRRAGARRDASTPSCWPSCSRTRTTRSRRRSRPAASTSTPTTSTAPEPTPDLLATLTELTAVTVADALAPYGVRR